MGLINDQIKAYRTILSQELKKGHWYQIPVWAPLIGHIGGADNGVPLSVPFGASKQKVLKPTFKPIEVLTDFNNYGIDMDIPIYYPFTDKPVYGDNPALGNEEAPKWAYQKAYINQIRKPVLIKDGLMGEKALSKKLTMQLMENAKDKLIDFNRRWQAYAPYDAILRGYSENLLAAKADGGLGHVLSQKSNPNFYVVGHGKVTWNDTAATYETNIATAADTLDVADVMSTKTIMNAIFSASQLRIRPVDFGAAGQYYVMIMNPAQALQLAQDQQWLDSQKAAITGERMRVLSPLFNGVLEGEYRGVLIVVDQNAPGIRTSGDTGYSSTRGTVNYGNDNPLASPIDTADRKLAILVGASAVMCGHSVSLNFETEDWDYKNKKSEASYTVVGYNRSDIYDNDGFFGTANLFKENTSSLVIATYSPDTLVW
ncbi:MAG: DUF4043 family protein [Candidatus Omnitrophica bacterium]|jgi:hypothetical protein|nr:DUF4043 family protein [Candidatus Omnitrophota bacterium]MDD5551165.1 DUF4043 family protein [Candidatus Omnitrophota bacterium]